MRAGDPDEAEVASDGRGGGGSGGAVEQGGFVRGVDAGIGEAGEAGEGEAVLEQGLADLRGGAVGAREGGGG